MKNTHLYNSYDFSLGIPSKMAYFEGTHDPEPQALSNSNEALKIKHAELVSMVNAMQEIRDNAGDNPSRTDLHKMKMLVTNAMSIIRANIKHKNQFPRKRLKNMEINDDDELVITLGDERIIVHEDFDWDKE